MDDQLQRLREPRFEDADYQIDMRVDPLTTQENIRLKRKELEKEEAKAIKVAREAAQTTQGPTDQGETVTQTPGVGQVTRGAQRPGEQNPPSGEQGYTVSQSAPGSGLRTTNQNSSPGQSW